MNQLALQERAPESLETGVGGLVFAAGKVTEIGRKDAVARLRIKRQLPGQAEVPKKIRLNAATRHRPFVGAQLHVEMLRHRGSAQQPQHQGQECLEHSRKLARRTLGFTVVQLGAQRGRKKTLSH
jgi:hypothetical protein